mmetsp:Transcript_112949/g.319415  ORF Transcript_112949/g.319415 Transcript_112949/m.319415 type:complete len:297 (-) Transcript_112949:68-958(-)
MAWPAKLTWGDFDAIVLAMALVMDVGWIAQWPSLGLPALVIALGLQAHAMASRRHEGVFVMAHESALLLWLLGNAFWMWGEYVYADGKPVGFLSWFVVLSNLSPSGYSASLSVGFVILWVALFGLHAVYIYFLPQLLHEGLAKVRGGVTLAHDGFNDVYRNLWCLPWLLMEACWVTCSLEGVNNAAIPRAAQDSGVNMLAFYVGSAAGVAALLLCGDRLRHLVAGGQLRDASLCVGELCWVAGNFVWQIGDILTGDTSLLAQLGGIALFCAGIVAAIKSTLLKDEERVPFALKCVA